MGEEEEEEALQQTAWTYRSRGTGDGYLERAGLDPLHHRPFQVGGSSNSRVLRMFGEKIAERARMVRRAGWWGGVGVGGWGLGGWGTVPELSRVASSGWCRVVQSGYIAAVPHPNPPHPTPLPPTPLVACPGPGNDAVGAGRHVSVCGHQTPITTAADLNHSVPTRHRLARSMRFN